MATLAEKLDKIKSPKLQNQHHVRSHTTAEYDNRVLQYTHTHIPTIQNQANRK